MSVPISNLPSSPLNVGMAPLLASATPETSSVSLATPSSATLITGQSASVTIPSIAQFVKVTVFLPTVTVSAAATITLSVYSGATSGTLTTLIQSQSFIAGTAATQFCGSFSFLIPVSTAAIAANNLQIGSTSFLSIAATASAGNFVVNGTSTAVLNTSFEVL